MMSDPEPRRVSFNPFPGLRYFTKQETHLFFGRDGQSDEIVRKLAQHHFVAVTGNSGSGKSSLVRAGLLPSLEAGYFVQAGPHWRIADLRPRNTPLANLSQALREQGLTEGVDPETLATNPGAILAACKGQDLSNLLILVDQFEELFRFTAHENRCADSDEKSCFVRLLLEAAIQRSAPVFLVITLRSDFLGDCAQFRDLPEMINASQYLVPRLTREQRKMAIEGPIHVGGARIAPRLVQRLLNEAGGDPDQLPVLQHALMRTWQHWQDRHSPECAIDFHDYEAIGTMERAISLHADEALQDASGKIRGHGEVAVRRIFQRLSDRDSEGRESRRPTSLGELRDVAELTTEQTIDAINCFRMQGRAFLTPLDGELSPETEIDVTHECLLRKWGRLKDEWNQEEEDSKSIFLRLAIRAADEFQKGQFSAYLTGPPLIRDLDWWRHRKPNAAWAARYHSGFALAGQYLNESDDFRKQEQKKRDDEQRKREQERIEAVRKQEQAIARESALAAEAVARRFRQKVAYGVAVGALCVAVLLGYLAFLLKHQSERATALLLASKAATAESQSDNSLEAAAVLAAQSLSDPNNPEGQLLLARALDLLPPRPTAIKPGVNGAARVAFSEDGTQFAAAGQDGVQVFDSQNGTSQFLVTLQSPAVNVLFGGEHLFVGSGNLITVHSRNDGRQVTQLKCPNDGKVRDFWVGQNGLSIVAICVPAFDSSTRVSDPSMFRWSAKAAGSAFAPSDLGFRQEVAAAGDSIALSGEMDRAAWDIPNYLGSTQIEVALKAAAPIELTTPHESPRILFVPGNFGSVIVGYSDGLVESLRYKKESQIVRDPAMADAHTILNLSSAVQTLAVSADGSILAAAGKLGGAKIWDLRSNVERARLVTQAPLLSVAVARTRVIAVDANHLIYRWTLGSDNRIEIQDGDSLNSARLSPGATYLIARKKTSRNLKNSGATTGEATEVDLFDTRTGKLLHRFDSSEEPYPVAISHDNKRIAMMDRRHGRQEVSIQEISLHSFSAGAIGNPLWHTTLKELFSDRFSFSPDGQYIAGTRLYYGMSVWSAKDGRELLPSSGGASLWTFGPQSGSIVIGEDKGVTVYDLAHGGAKEITPPWLRSKPYTKVRISPDHHLMAVVEENGIPLGPPGLIKSVADLKVLPSSEPELVRDWFRNSVLINQRRVIRILELPSGRERVNIPASTPVSDIVFSPDSFHLAAIGRDKTIHVWDVKTKQEIARMASALEVMDMAFTQDDKLAIADESGFRVRPWKARDLVDTFCKTRLTHNLTQDEWEQHAPPETYARVCRDVPTPVTGIPAPGATP